MIFRRRRRTIHALAVLLALAISGCNRGVGGPAPGATTMPAATPSMEAPPAAAPPPTPADSAIVAISPASGPPGTEVQVTGAGFPPEAPVELGVGRVDSEYDVIRTSRTGTEGDLDVALRIPGFAEPGEPWVVVVVVPDDGTRAISNVFDVTGAGGEPEVAVAPQSFSPGDAVTVTARGFPPNAGVEIGLGRVNSEYDVIAEGSTDAVGSVSTRVTVPGFVEPEDRWVFVVATADHTLKAISPVLDVRGDTGQQPTSTPDGFMFTRTNIYLIAVGEGGQTGEEIGCGDSVVPVEIEIEPTVAPLTAALEYLLALDSREYGQSGLYNALHSSDLAVEGIDIASREAVIHLTGTLKLGGACDAPRVAAQLRETALQYSTIDAVVISIDGVALDELLSSR